jgi:hypothetical protein
MLFFVLKVYYNKISYGNVQKEKISYYSSILFNRSYHLLVYYYNFKYNNYCGMLFFVLKVYYNKISHGNVQKKRS